MVLESVFCESSDGRLWASPPIDNTFWEHYLDIFDEVVIIARLRRVSQASGQSELNRSRLSIGSVPDYQGPWQFIRSLRPTNDSIRNSVRDCDAIIARVPSALSLVALPHILAESRPLALEVVGHPEDVFANTDTGGLLAPVYQQVFGKSLRWMCERADCVSYVTERYLQQSYPPGRDAVTTHYSDVELGLEDLAESPRLEFAEIPVRLLSVGSLNQLYKGPDVLLDALAFVRKSLDVDLTWVGGGRHIEAMRSRCTDLDLGESVRFVGPVSGRASVQAYLDAAAILVMPSRTEGLPRAIIEGMARGLPCIGTNVGGVPELLSDDVLVPPDDPEALADKIIELAGSPERLVHLSQRNLQEARRYLREHLEPRRRKFYETLRQVAESRIILSNRDA